MRHGPAPLRAVPRLLAAALAILPLAAASAADETPPPASDKQAQREKPHRLSWERGPAPSSSPDAANEPKTSDQAKEKSRPTLDDLLNLPDSSGNKPAANGPSAESNASTPGPSSEDTPDAATPEQISEAGRGDPFQQAVGDMKKAAERLSGQAGPGLDTQRVQERAIARLDQIIDQLRNQQGSSSDQQQKQQSDTGNQRNQSRPSRSSQSAKAKNPTTTPAQRAGSRGRVREGTVENQALHERLREWGNLPPQLRDELLQGRDDAYSPLYRELTERYYRRLAEEAPQ